MDNKQFSDLKLNEDVPAPDMANAQRVFDRIVDTARSEEHTSELQSPR